jgi:hypothetical protein
VSELRQVGDFCFLLLDGDKDCYKEINHGSNIYADMVTAQVLLPNAHISDGQGI